MMRNMVRPLLLTVLLGTAGCSPQASEAIARALDDANHQFHAREACLYETRFRSGFRISGEALNRMQVVPSADGTTYVRFSFNPGLSRLNRLYNWTAECVVARDGSVIDSSFYEVY